MAPRVELLFTGSDDGATAAAIGAKEAVESLGQAAEDAGRSVTTGMSATLLEFRAMDDAINRVSADYEAGLLSQQEWTQALAAQRTEAIALRQATGDLSGKELRAFTSVLDKTAKTSSEATFKIDLMRGGMRQLAQQATGAQGPIGLIISSLLQMAGGSGLVVGAAAVVGVLAMAYKALAREAIAAEKAQDDAIKRLIQLREASRTDEIKRAEDVALAREKLGQVTTDITAAEARLLEQRGRGSEAAAGAALDTEAQLTELRAEQLRLLQAINAPEIARQARENAEHEKAYKEALEETGTRLALIAIRVAHAGLSQEELTEALRRNELARRDLTDAEIAGLIVTEREIAALEQQLAQRLAIVELMRTTAAQMRELGDAPLRSLTAPRSLLPQQGRDTVDIDPLSASEELSHRMVDSFGLSIDMVDELGKSMDNLASGSLAALGSAFESVFEAIISGGRISGQEMVAGLLGAISKAAVQEGAFYFARGVAALAGAVFPVPNPQNAVSASQYFTAAALMGAIGVGTGLAAGAVGGGGGGSNLSPERFRENTRSLQDAEGGEVRVIVRGSAAVLARDPEFVQSVGEAFAEAAGTRQVIIELDDGSYASVQHIKG